MQTRVTPELLRELEEMYQATTPGDWRPDEYMGKSFGYIARQDGSLIADIWSDADQQFIIVAHNAMPALLAELTRLRRVEEAARKLIDTFEVIDVGSSGVAATINEDAQYRLEEALDSK